jgi:hypothetical protein
MASMEVRHDDIVIQRRVHSQGATQPVTQVYAVTYPNHTGRDTECRSYEEAERVALELAEARGLTVWYEENPSSARRTLIKSFRN